MSLVDLMRPQGVAAPVQAQVPLLTEGTVLAVVAGGLMVVLDDPDVQYGPCRWTPPAHVHAAGTVTTGAAAPPSPVGRDCLVAFADGDPGRGWVLAVA